MRSLIPREKIDKASLVFSLRLFYCLIPVIIFLGMIRFAASESEMYFRPTWPVFFLNDFSQLTRRMLFFSSCLLAILFSFIAVSKPFNRNIKLIVAILYTFLLAYIWSLGWSDHDLLFPLYALWGYSFLRNKDEKNWNIYIFATQFFFLLPYFCAGLWKLRSSIGFIYSYGWSSFHPLETSLAWHKVFKAGLAQPPIFSFLTNNTFWFLALFFELLILIIAFRPKFQRWGGYAIFAFHFCVPLIFEGFYYYPAILIAIPLFILGPYSKKESG